MLKACKHALLTILFAIGLLFTALTAKAYGSTVSLPNEMPRMIMSRYSSQSLLSHQTWYREVDGRYEAYFNTNMVLDSSDFCSTLLEAAQNFSLNVMVDDSYISSEQKEILKKIGDRLNRSQFRFFEFTQPVDTAAANNREFSVENGDIPITAIPLMTEKNIVETVGTVYTVAGQITSSHVRKQHVRMPWQIDDEYKHLELDREKYSLVWEVGRAAQKSPKSFQTLFKAVALGMLNDVLAYGENIENAYVFAHALGPAQKRLFQIPKIKNSKEPIFQVFHEANTESSDVVLVARLIDLLDYFSPETFSKLIADVIATAKHKITPMAAIEHIFALRDSIRQDIDVILPQYGRRSRPLILRNTTPVPGWFVAEVAKRHGIYDVEGPEIAKLFSKKRWTDTFYRELKNEGEVIPPTDDLTKHKVFAISNLDPEVAQKDPDYVTRIFLATFFYYEKKLRASYPMQTDALLAQTYFAITTVDDRISKQAMKIAHVQPVQIQFTEYKAKLESSPDSGVRMQPELTLNLQPMFVISGQDLLELTRVRKDLAPEARKAFRLGNWQLLQHLRAPIEY